MSPINVISCSSYRLLEEEIKKITKDNPYTTIDNNQVTFEEIIEEASYTSLFDEEKYIVIKNTNIFNTKRNKKEETDDEEEQTSNDDEKLFDKYLDNPNPKTIMIFALYTKPALTKKITKKVKERYNLITITEFDYKEIQKRIQDYFKEKKYTYENDVPYYISTCCQNNYDLVMNELEKIELYYGKPNKVLLSDVTNIISKPLEDNNFKFIDAVIDKKLEEAINILNDLIIQKVSPLMLLIILSREYRNILYTMKYLEKYSKDEIQKKLDIKYSFQMDKIINRTYQYREKELEDILLLATELNYKMTTGKVEQRTALELFILKICE